MFNIYFTQFYLINYKHEGKTIDFICLNIQLLLLLLDISIL